MESLGAMSKCKTEKIFLSLGPLVSGWEPLEPWAPSEEIRTRGPKIGVYVWGSVGLGNRV